MLAPTTTFVPETTIRAMTVSDIPAVREMAMRIWRQHYVPDIVTAGQIEYMLPLLYSEEAITRNLKEKSHQFRLLYCGGKLAGYIAVEPRDNGVWFVDKLYIDVDIQRRSLGSMLLERIITELSPRELQLRVNRKNYKAVNFYFRHGFCIESLHVLDIGSGFVMDDFIMKRVL